jgi:hypothetical protein
VIAGNYVFHAFNVHPRPKDGTKQIQFCRAKALAGIRRGTNWTVVLDQQETAILFPSDLRHVTFLGADLGQFLEPPLQ